MLKNLPIICSEQGRGSHIKMGVIEISRPEVLNALNTESYHIIESKLKHWLSDPSIASILIYSENEKAFCAGGDVKNLVIETRKNGLQVAENFFAQEYFVDYWLHQYQKPIIALADGITMGGGLGLIQGTSHRIVTDRTLMAMPELSIGLFPDVGATHFLGLIPNHFGLFMGLTGARIHAGDALAVQLADFYLPHTQKRKLISDLLSLPWVEDVQKNHNLLTNYLLDVLVYKPEPTQLNHYLNEIATLDDNDYASLYRQMTELEAKSDFIRDSQTRFMQGSELSKQLFFQAFQQHKGLPLVDVFLREWEMAVRACEDGDFFEGVRALLIEKDQKPKWRFQPNEFIADINSYFKTTRSNLLREKIRQLVR